MKADTARKLDDFERFLSDYDGPDVPTYKDRFFEHIDGIAEDMKDSPDRDAIEKRFYEICSKLEVSPIHKRCRDKPLGYAGDYQVIDWIYTHETASKGKARTFDEMFHTYEGAEAVRNRKKWFVDKCLELSNSTNKQLEVLDLGCGPCRDVMEAYIASGNGRNMHFHCVDHEPEALDYAKKLLASIEYQDNIQLDCTNVFRIKTDKKYDLIWSAGLFDYLDDRIAALLIKKMWRHLKDGGQFVFGNFSPKNPAREGMGLALKWYLIHRTAEELVKIVRISGVPFREVEIESEELGVNLFCVITK